MSISYAAKVNCQDLNSFFNNSEEEVKSEVVKKLD